MLTDTVNEAIKQAMLQKEKEKLNALRAIKSELLLLKADHPGTEITEEMEIKMLQRMIKQRKEAAEQYVAAGRQELADNELAEAKVLEEYVPRQLTPEEIEVRVREIIAQTGAASPADMGKVMGVASKQLAGLADGRTLSTIVRQLLAQG